MDYQKRKAAAENYAKQELGEEQFNALPDAVESFVENFEAGADWALANPESTTTSTNLVSLLCSEAKRYAKDARLSITRNDHMNELPNGQLPTQQQVEAVLVDFINAVGARRGIDVALYSVDLHEQA